jgi:hypothetical protein
MPYDMPFCIIGDYFFPLCTWFMKAYNIDRVHDRFQKIFNYHFSRARRVEESAFGILANKYGCLLKSTHNRGGDHTVHRPGMYLPPKHHEGALSQCTNISW